MDPQKTPAVERDPDIRNKDFLEVSLGYTTPEMAINEAKRCLNCKNSPCVSGCPVNVRIPEFIKEVSEGNFLEAYKIISSTKYVPFFLLSKNNIVIKKYKWVI